MGMDYGTCKFCPAKLKKHKQAVCGDCYNKHRKQIKGTPAPPVATDSFTAQGDTAEIGKMTPENVRTLADLVRVCQIDTDEWIVERWVANKWEVGTKNPADGTVTTTPLYQVKAWLRRNVPLIDARTEIAALVADAKKQIAPRPFVKRKDVAPFMLEIAIPDLHLGKLAWAPETGGANYDSKIAAELFVTALEALVARTAAFKFEKILFPIGQDFFHSDTKQGTTTKGTPLDTDSRYHKTFIAGRRLIIEAIDRLRTVAPVEVVVVPGNHDALGAFHLGDSISCYYHNTRDVTVQNDPIPRKYVSYGRNLIMYVHGHTGKKPDYPLLMATEQSELFGKALFREIHSGHTHESKLVERMGVRWRVSPALCPADSWHSEQHFVGNLRAAEALVWSRDEGNVAMATYTVIEDRKVAS